MKASVITLTGSEKSMASAQRVINAAKKAGLRPEIFEAVSRNVSEKALEDLNVIMRPNDDETGDRGAMLGCLASHIMLWNECITSGEPLVVLEHDAIFVDQMPADLLRGHQCVNLGKPSYGRVKWPLSASFILNFIKQGFKLGSPSIYSLFCRQHFPGTHAYYLEPEGAKLLLAEAREHGARAVDLFMRTDYFPFLEEVFPWPVVAIPEFSSIQDQTGAAHTHAYRKAQKKGAEYQQAADFWEEHK